MNEESRSIKLHCSSCGRKRWGKFIGAFFKAFSCGHTTHLKEIYPKGNW